MLIYFHPIGKPGLCPAFINLTFEHFPPETDTCKLSWGIVTEEKFYRFHSQVELLKYKI